MREVFFSAPVKRGRGTAERWRGRAATRRLDRAPSVPSGHLPRFTGEEERS